MRVRAYVERLAPEDQQQLFNRLTLGVGWLAQAARLTQADGPCGPILAALTASLRFLVAVAQTLREGPVAVAAGPVGGGMDRGGCAACAGATSWRRGCPPRRRR